MAYVVGDKTFRNLEEQVLKNKEDIARHYETDRVLADWGIKVLGVVNSVEELPSENNNFGDAYGVAGDPIDYYIWTRANANVGEENDYWLNVGALSLIGPRGPQGVQGIQGPTGQRGSKWYSGKGVPASGGGDYKDNDQYLNAANGDVYLYSSQHWVLQGNIRGPQGVQGPAGPQGIQGIQGPQGPQGVKGDAGSSFQVVGILASTDLLPTPTAANRSKAYIIDGDMYIVIGDTSLSWYNAGVVEGVEGPQGPAGPQGPVGADIQVVHITGIPSTATSGTLTQEQVNTLLAHPSNYIQFFNENFYPQDVETSQGYIVYSHVGMYEGNTKIKTITLTINSRSWVLTETPVVSRAITYVDALPEANKEEFDKHKIYQTGALLKYIAVEASEDINITLTNTLPENICDAPSATVGDNIYIIGGQKSTSTSSALSTIYKYNTTTNTLTTTSATLQTSYACACAVGTYIYIFGGTKKFENESKNIVRFNTLTDSVEIVYTNTKYFKYGACAAVGTNIYLFGGTNYTSNIQKFDTTTNTLTTLSTNLPEARITLSVGVANNNNIYLFGGTNSSWSRQKTIYKFNPSTNVIETLTETLPENLSGVIVTNEINGYIYIIGGSTTNGVSNVIYRFNVSTETIETMTHTFSTNIQNAASGGNGDFYTFGGLSTSSGSALNSIYKLSVGLVYSFKTILTE